MAAQVKRIVWLPILAIAGAIFLVAMPVEAGYLLTNWLAFDAGPSCEPAFAVWLGRDPIFVAPPGSIVSPDSDQNTTYCSDGDDDDPGAAYAGKDFKTTLSPTDVVRHYRDAASRQGWQTITVLSPRDENYEMCARKDTPDGHKLYLHIGRADLRLPTSLPAGTRTYEVSIAGDVRDPVAC